MNVGDKDEFKYKQEKYDALLKFDFFYYNLWNGFIINK